MNNRRQIEAERRKSDKKFILDKKMRDSMRAIIKGKCKDTSIFTRAIKVTPLDFLIHIERQFKEGMNWDNYGKHWHIDHITPRCQFNYSFFSDDQFQLCYCLNNLRPLEKEINLRRKRK